MKIKFLGHASFLITSESGIRVITDPYKPGCFDGGIQYGPITEEADIVTISHEHDDHCETNINGNPAIVMKSDAQEVKGIRIVGTEVYHDTSKGKERGRNTIFKIVMDGMNIVHLGDLGHDLSRDEAERIGKVDILFVPVGGFFTIDAHVAENVIDTLKPKVVIPMHFKTEKCGFPIAPVEGFIKDKSVKEAGGEVEISKASLPAETTIYVLSPTK